MNCGDLIINETKEDEKDKFDKMFFLFLMLFGAAPEEERKKFLQRMKEIEEEPDWNGGD